MRLPDAPLRARLVEVALLFLRLGVTAFGGPAAHIAMMETEVVRKRRWITPERFLDLMGAANLIPGPSSSELAIFIGYERAGAAGLVAAGLCFVLPAALLTGGIAWGYVRFEALPQVGGLLYGVKPVVIAIVVQALWRLAPKAAGKSWWLAGLGVLACAAAALGVEALAVMLGAGALSAIVFATRRKPAGDAGPRSPSPLVALGASGGASATAAAVSATAAPAGLAAIFLVFLKLGAVVFGSGYVLLAFLRADLVERLHWMTEAQLLDAVAVGQVTPGPVFTTATFLGYLLGGGWGAAVATVGIFLPAFALVGAIRPLVARLRASPGAASFLDGVNVASLALMAVVTVQLGRTALVDVPTIAVAGASALLLVRFGVNATWLVAAGAIVGLAAHPR
jgi:chromate transporter